MDNPLVSLQVICPVYNEQDVLEIFYKELKNVLLSVEHSYQWKVMFVMDRSTDSTIQILRRLTLQDERVQILALSNRFGHQMSLVAGIDHSDSDVVIMMDSDLQHPPELIPELLSAYENGNDVVYTIRNEPRDKNILKRFGSRSFYRIMSWLSELPLTSGEADYRLISRRIAEIFKSNIRERNQFLRGLFCWVGFKRKGIRFDSTIRIEGVSKYNWSRMFSFAATGIISFSKKPLQYAIVSGLLFSSLGILSAIFTFFSYFVSEQAPTGWTTLSILVSVFGGIQLLFMGIIGEYIGAIFDEVKARPLYLVEERINID